MRETKNYFNLNHLLSVYKINIFNVPVIFVNYDVFKNLCIHVLYKVVLRDIIDLIGAMHLSKNSTKEVKNK